ncbi:hypothetical protein LHJ74_22265 [Streptomyces sp. N2-109]|uniref:SRPBCC family protein n=1 Tax=Streptomyces gossypii TaxID=2883101 RepID=A0ABT2JZ42_9ACTN|nr:hypothetical protein [Streptomyces gossypii]MCT2592600.1 hypothetical protein [Streptomyces gossypii]
MARFRHRVTIVPVPRRWFEAYLLMLHDLAESVRAEPDGALRLSDGRAVPEVRLAHGEHLRPGTRYEAQPEADGSRAALLIQEWQRASATAVRLEARSADGAELTGSVRLAGARRPGTLGGDWHFTAPGRSSVLRRASGMLRVDLAAWWSAADRRRGARRGTAPVTGAVDHRLARARLRVTPRAVAGGRVELTCTVSVRGRALARPLVGLALLVGRVRVRRELAAALDETAARWNKAAPGVLRKDAAQLRAELTEQLLRAPDGADGAEAP